MHVLRIQTDANTHVLGNCSIDLFHDADRYTYNSSSKSHLYLDGSEEEDYYYTFLIGDNGIGKTTLLKILSNSSYKIKVFEDGTFKNKHRFHTRVSIISSKEDSSYKDCQGDSLPFCYSINPSSVNESITLLFELKNKLKNSRSPSRIDLLEKLLDVKLDENIEISFHFKSEPTKEGTYSVFFTQENKDWDYQTFLSEFEKTGDKRNRLSKSLYYHYFLGASNTEEASASLILQKIQNIVSFVNEKHSNQLQKEEINQLDANQKVYPINELTVFDIYLIALLEEVGLIDINIRFLSKESQLIPVKNLSSGQLQMIRLYCILSILPLDKMNKIVFLYDEPEISLHPRWQLEFPYAFQKIVNLYNIHNSHFIFATHSPLLVMRASSITNCSVIKLFLDREDGNQLKSEIIEHVNRYSIARLLFDEFDFSYYTREEQSNLKKELFERLRWSSATEGKDLYKDVKRSFNVMDQIDTLYREIFIQHNNEQ